MKNRDLIESLNQFPEDAEVIFNFNREFSNVEVSTGLKSVRADFEIDENIEFDGEHYEDDTVTIYFA